jgi:hypothetical protein
MPATISLANNVSHSGYFNISITINNTSGSSLTGATLKPVSITLPNGVSVAPPFGNTASPSFDPLVLNSWTLPTIASNTSFTQTSLLPVNSAFYQTNQPHICQFQVIDSGASISNTLLVTITPLSDLEFSDPSVAALHNNSEVLSYSATISNTTFAPAFSSTLDSTNLTSSGNLQISSTSTLDTQTYLIIGLNASGSVITERGLLTGTSEVTSVNSFSLIYDFFVKVPASGTITVSQSSTTYVTVPPNFQRSTGFRFADTRPRLIYGVSLGTGATCFLELTYQGFAAGSVETPLWQNTFGDAVTPVYFWPPIYVPHNSIVRGSTMVSSGSASILASLSTAPISGF